VETKLKSISPSSPAESSTLLRHALLSLLMVLIAVSSGCATTSDDSYFETGEAYFGLRFIDAATGRGVPLVEIKSNNHLRYISDSAGWIAIDPYDLGAKSVYFRVATHGYELDDKGAIGKEAIILNLGPGKRRTVELGRTNIAERLYRITGEGIYHHSLKLGISAPHFLPNEPRGGVFGQDSVNTVIYNDELYWFWGDTRRANGPLGNFKVSGATSPSPLRHKVDANMGVDLDYFIGPSGFVRSMCPFEGNQTVWIGGLSVVKHAAEETLFCHYVRSNNAMEILERGIAQWDDNKKVFVEKLTYPEDSPEYPRGAPLKMMEGGQPWFYYGELFRNTRVRATVDNLLDLKTYESYTCLKPGSRWNPQSPPLDLDSNGNPIWSWKKDTDLVDYERWETMANKGLVKSGDNPYVLIDMETGDRVIPTYGSISLNKHNKKWSLITVQYLGDSAFGEIWYAIADSPMGPWSKAKKIISHNAYSFYNVRQHPYFSSDSFIYLEGSYTKSFSGSKNPTPRYDYNQIMYRLDLDDPRLPQVAPAANPANRPPNLRLMEY
jgi:hypothetical protein